MGMSLSSRSRLALGLLTLSGLALAALAIYYWAASEPVASGTVRLDGQPIVTGSIKFVPVAGTPGPDAGAAIEEGKYRIEKGLQVGQYRVEIHGIRKSPTKKVFDPFLFGARLVPDEREAVDRNYNQNSKIVRTVNRGVNTLDFEVEGPKGRADRTAKEAGSKATP
jgi:hypothetical protein